MTNSYRLFFLFIDIDYLCALLESFFKKILNFTVYRLRHYGIAYNITIVPRKKLKKMKDAGFIPGIYNYCDRWCEKCDQKLHCMSFVMGKKIEERGGFNFDEEISQEEENVWARLKDVFESTYEVLHELAKERGIDVEDIYTSENIDREFWGEDYENMEMKGERYNLMVEDSDIVRICMIYEDLSDKCLEKVFEILDEKFGEEKGQEMDEVLETVGWYQDLMQSKMRRALHGYYHVCSCGEEKEDYNGSAKVALIAISRSEEAWKTLLAHCPEMKREILQLSVVLTQLKKDILFQFPEAEKFRRPGFEN